MSLLEIYKYKMFRKPTHFTNLINYNDWRKSKLFSPFCLIIGLIILTGCLESRIETPKSWKKINPFWVVSCGITDSESYKKLDKDTFVFKIDVKDIGRCPSDRFPYEDAYLQFPWSERQEINTNPLGYGIYEFSALIQIETTGLNAFRNTMFQIHDFRDNGAPPSYLQVYGGKSGTSNRFRLSHPECRSIRCRENLPNVPKAEFKLKVIFEHRPKILITNYFINDELIISGGGQTNSPIYVKIGIYRILGKSSTIQTYRNVMLRKLI